MFVSTTPQSSSPDSSTHRRRSSVSNVPHEGSAAVRDGSGPLNLWSHSTTPKQPARDPRRSTFSRRLSTGGSAQLTSPNGSAVLQKPFKRDSGSTKRSPTLSPRKRASHSTPSSPSTRPTNRSPPPVFDTDSVPTLPRLTYDAASASTSDTPATPGLVTPLTLSTTGADYFSSGQMNLAQSPNWTPESAMATKAYSPSRGAIPAGTRQVPLSQDFQGGASVGDTKGTGMSARRLSIPRINGSSVDSTQRSDADTSSEIRRTSDTDGSDAARQKDRREQDKKTMLSKALQKAHTAVLLDNAQNFEGAIEAYGDACRLLQQVLIRSSGEEDRRKLDAIRTTYTNRIQELQQLNIESQQTAGKSLPARPMSNSSHSAQVTPRSLDPFQDDDEEPVIIETATLTRIVPDKLLGNEQSQSPKVQQQAPASLVSAEGKAKQPKVGPSLRPPDAAVSNYKTSERFLSVESPMDANYVPPPLSPRRLQPETKHEKNAEQLQPPELNPMRHHSRGSSGNSISWLDTIDESGGSSGASSVHSLTDRGLYRKHVRLPSGDTEAEFDAALDAAVEAAYDDGLELYEYDQQSLPYKDIRASEPVKAMVDNERKRLSDRDQIIQAAHSRTRELRKEALGQDKDLDEMDDIDEEERILDEMSKDFGFDFGLQSKSAMPRQSDSSGYSGSTWHSSISSSRTTAITSLSTVAETPDTITPGLKVNGNLPRLSEEGSQRDSLPLSDAVFSGQQSATLQNGSVRSRRMSGQNAKQLKIETSINIASRKPLSHPTLATQIVEDGTDGDGASKSTARPDIQTLPDSVFKPPGHDPQLAPPPTYIPQSSPLPSTSPAITHSPATPAPNQAVAAEGGSPKAEPKASGSKSGPLKKNKSSISLKNRALSISSPDGSEASIGTPLSTTFSAFSNQSRKPLPHPNLGAPPTPNMPTFGEAMSHTNSNINLFESDIHSPYVPGSPNPLAANAPIPLEPCPDSHLLRPFWLMRCFYQTIAHPRGGYLSTKLFVPRDVWRVKGVKIKGIDDKVSNCDLLTAALLKLGSVDTLDADAVLDEMQALEVVLDQVQGNLIKKLGSEVGVQGIASLFKDAPVLAGDGNQGAESGSNTSRTISQGKSYLSSWRKLRSKSSAVTLTPAFSSSKDQTKDTLTLSTLPMTSLPNPRFAKRDVSQLDLSGPQSTYMSSLARLFDAVQVIDQVARQVEDPGLKHSSPTHVGLELCTRHASEFFGFYVCRFVLTDLTMLLDKFIKRGSEWVLV